MTETESILIDIGEFLEVKSGTFGIDHSSKEDLKDKALLWLKNNLCPRKQEIVERARSTEVEVAIILAEIIMFALGNHIPGIPMLAKSIAILGINQFCDDPVQIILLNKNE